MLHLVTLAYLDPGSGSMLLQAIVGGSAGILVFARHLYRSWKFRWSLKSETRKAE